MMKLIVLTAAVLSLSFTAQANSKFEKALEEASKYCSFGDCELPYVSEELYNAYEKVSKLSQAQFDALLKIAKTQSRVWADTILEGDYVTEGETTLGLVTSISKDGKLIAYRISYLETAWDTGACDYDYENKASLENCTQGQIHESSFVSPDLKTFTRDEDAIAEFSE